ncbi:hypothetical protein Sphch_1500 [Sphingobium chlorophenolicum L-1]|uniref:Uncharacterized protein n=1 Tax=Sphingobium chlorophenolicum L-1 TaxID=690566 RepID=F6EYI6_SPHCR|nr:hypothetical protein [Sphingobium chlorophenolicum]AEG49188.1 hypothetical protein Sphch_1500 [Sphingobium chlorophenolicum L-1]
MPLNFSDIPEVVIDYVRERFAVANAKVTRTLEAQPSMYEETLDHLLVMELTASPRVFFAAEQIGLSIESHWLGSRWMYGRWEIADIAFFITLRQRGRLEARKLALLQTKRLYSKEIDVAELEDADYRIGIGRLADRIDPQVPLSQPRWFSFDADSVYGAMRAGHEQVQRIDAYMGERDLPVYYGLYNPPVLPFRAAYPQAPDAVPHPNEIGCRVIPAPTVHAALDALPFGQHPSFQDLTLAAPLDGADERSRQGWRIETFIADEVLRCRQGSLFDQQRDPNLQALLYGRSAPIAAAISITIDFGSGSAE